MSGYIGSQPVPQATQHRESFTATGGQTSFATAGYTPQFIDVYLNGVKLAPADYTASNGSDVVLASGATASDILEIVAYTPFEIASQTFTGDTTANNFAVTGTFTSRGIDDNADAVAITIDSSENVGIGTASPDRALHVNTSQDYVAKFSSSDAGAAILLEDSNSTANYNRIGVITHDMQFVTNNSEAMRIDASGNLLVGTTNVDIGSATSGFGFSYKASNGALQIARQASSATKPALVLNTTGVDSSILDFRKDGTTVGSIGTDYDAGIYVGGGTSALFYNQATAGLIQPYSVTGGAVSDGVVQLGEATSRFKDLYLSGGVFLGGTGAANKLDDYEEGTWNLGVETSGITLTSASIASGRYTKIGNSVTIYCLVTPDSATSSAANFTITGLPFQAAGAQAVGAVMSQYVQDSGQQIVSFVPSGTNTLRFYETDSGAWNRLKHSDITIASDLYVTVTYMTS